MVQAVVYPSLRSQEAGPFKARHRVYTRRMGYIVAPLMIAQLALSSFRLLSDPSNLLSILHWTLVAGTWGATFSLSVPLHKKLQARGKCPTTLAALVATNWIRTALWSLAFSVALANLSTA